MMTFKFKSISFLLALSMLLAVLPAGLLSFATETPEEEPIYVLAGGDFQESGDHANSANNVAEILAQISGKYPAMDGMIFTGDYDNETHNDSTQTKNGIDSLMSTVQKTYGNINHDNSILVQGNHDYSDSRLDATGGHDLEHYSVFVINEDDYPYGGGSSSNIQNLANRLKTWLDEKLEDEYSKPIFIASHLPLAYGPRTYTISDGKYASYLFEVLNEAGKNGLNIIFMHGHDHSWGADNYIGGEAIYLPKGESINIPVSSDTSKWTTHTLNFTYMNSGYVGYYSDDSSYDSGSEKLTMTVFSITDSKVTVERYSKNGLYNMKSEGRDGSHSGSGRTATASGLGLEFNTTVYASPQTFYLNRFGNTVTDNGISVTAPGVTGLNANKSAGTADKLSYNSKLYRAYALYDINPVGYEQGTMATVTITLDPADGFKQGQGVVIIDKKENKQVTKPIVDGKVTFTTDHFSEFALAQYISTEIVVEGSSGAQEVERIEWVTTLEVGVPYIIVCDRAEDLNNANSVLTNSSSNNQLRLIGRPSTSTTHYWYYNGTNLIYGSPDNANGYLVVTNGGASLGTASSGNRANNIFLNNNANNDRDTFSIGSTNSSRYLNQYGGDSASVAGGYTQSGSSSNGWANPGSKWRFYKVIFEEKTEPVNLTVAIDSTEGRVKQKAAGGAMIGSVLYVTDENGNQIEEVQITVDMLKDSEGNPISTNNAGVFENLSVWYTYNGKEYKVFDNYTLEVTAPSPYPDYPDEGAVRVNKTANGLDFQSTGVAKVELSAMGVPSKKGVDVIVMLDTSSSMTKNNVEGTNKTRATVLEESLEKMIQQFKAPGEDGNPLDIRVAMADFNGFYDSSNSPYYRDTNDNFGGSFGANSAARVYTGNGQLGAGAFINASDLQNTYTLNYASGTNYDYAMDAIYQLGSAITLQNEERGEVRDLYVIFMTDGAANQYNYYTVYSTQNNTATHNYNQWLDGSLTADDLANNNTNGSGCDQHLYYYNYNDTNGDGQLNEHWMANAIKGDPDQRYNVIRKQTTGLTSVIGAAIGDMAGKQNMYSLPGLGAKMYAIAFDIGDDNYLKTENIIRCVQGLPSTDEGTTKYFYNVTSADALTSAFATIGSDIAYAATDAVFVDEIGDSFDLQLTPVTDLKGNPYLVNGKQLLPTIEIKQYDIWTRAEWEAKKCDYDQIGTRKTDSNGNFIVTRLELIEFYSEGNTVTAAYSDLRGNGTNIYKDGVIYGQTIIYNTNKTAVMIDTDGDGAAETELGPETFYWKIGTINTKEIALAYYVYLTDSMTGLPAGSYNTNNDATLHYTNYMGQEECKSAAIPPAVAWQSASVNYAFYLVNKNGDPVNSHGIKVPFANRVQVTRPVFYKELLLNNLDVVNSIDVASLGILPEGYTLYDEKAKYSIVIHSDSTGEWSIVSSADKTQSTYVTGFSDTIPFSNVSSEDNDAYDYTHTTVWFAVLWIPSTIPDYIVIDYGLPVDISVLVNDQFGDYGRIVGLGTLADQAALGIDENELYSTSKSDRFTNPAGGLQLTHGKISIAGNKVRYVLDDMNSAGVDTFVYEVEFTYYEHFENGLPVGAPQLRYFYGVVTVIPATIIYYEESFVEFSNSATPEGELGTWKDITDESYNADANITQAEDRPGFFSLALIDANNIYGFDQAYQNFTQYSLGSAKMVNVNAATGSMQNAPKVTFSFTGTGFDIISLTNSESGTILVTVEGSGGFKKTKAVDNYYGYKYNAETGKWEVYPDVTPDCIWQVPVIKFDNLAFDTYTVTIQLAYMDALDHIEDDSYCFWMDAVRIYDPADTSVVVNPESGVTIGGIYEQDRENQPYFETLRDLLIADLTGTDGAPHISGELPGVVFIDGKSETNSVVDYQNPGPNHETYLAHTQGIAFRLVANQKPISVHLGVKLAHGNSATLMLNDAGFVTVNTATDRYFDLGAKLIWKESTSNGMTVWSTDTIYLSNNSANTIISLTNLKCVGAIAELDNEYGGAGTGNEASSGLTVQSSLGNSASSYQTRQNTKEMPFSVVVDAQVIEDAIATMKLLYNTTMTPPVFLPQSVTANWNVGAWKGHSVLTVTTSEDVQYITVDGNQISTFIRLPAIEMGEGNKIQWKRIFLYTVEENEIGTYQHQVLLYNSRNHSSQAMDAPLNVDKFIPEDVDCHWQGGVVGEWSTLTVTTSDDVEQVRVGDTLLTEYVRVPVKIYQDGVESYSWCRVWTWSVKLTQAGRYDFGVTVYDIDGNASNTVNTTVNGKES